MIYMPKVLVCGGRTYADRLRMSMILTNYKAQHGNPSIMIIHGNAPGADTHAGVWAVMNGQPEVKVPAQWDTYGKGAGPIRNGWMLQLKPDVVIAFPGGNGTANMAAQANGAGIEVIVVAP